MPTVRPAIGPCFLCGAAAPLQNSHIMPRFAVDWLRRTSATGFLRSGRDANQRVQDGTKRPLLCADCEQRIGRWERAFAQTVFVPYLEQSVSTFTYADWFGKFTVSLALRTAALALPRMITMNEPNLPVVYQAIDAWRAYLLGNEGEFSGYAHHVLFVGPMASVGADLRPPPKANWYFARSIECTIVSAADTVFAYSKLPGFIFISAIQPTTPDGLDGSRIYGSGTISASEQHTSNTAVCGFLWARAQATADPRKAPSARQMQQIAKALERDPDRALRSESLQVHLADRRLGLLDGQSSTEPNGGP